MRELSLSFTFDLVFDGKEMRVVNRPGDAIRLRAQAGVGQIGPLGLVDPTTIAGVELLSGVFVVVLDWEAPDG